MEQTAAEYIRETVHREYYEHDTNCAGVTLKCLSHLLGYEIGPQAFSASLGMHGAGGYRAQCGLAEGGLLFLGMYLTDKGYDRAAVIRACYGYGQAFEEKFGALTCRALRPQGFAPGQPPHMCEQLTCCAVEFSYEYVRGVTEKALN